MLLWVTSSSWDVIEPISVRQSVLPVVFSGTVVSLCVYLDATELRTYFSDPVTAPRAYLERLKYVNDVILVILVFKMCRRKVVRDEKSVADLCLKIYSFLHVSFG